MVAPPPAESASSKEPSPNLQQQLQQVAAAAAAVDPDLAAESSLRFPLPSGAASQPQTGAAGDGVPGESSLTNLGDSALLQPSTVVAASEQQQVQLDPAAEQQQVQQDPAETQQEAPAAQADTRGPRHQVCIFQSADAEDARVASQHIAQLHAAGRGGGCRRGGKRELCELKGQGNER